MLVLRYEDGDIRVMLVSSCEFERDLHALFIDFFPYEWRLGTGDGLFLPIYPPRSMRVVLCVDD